MGQKVKVVAGSYFIGLYGYIVTVSLSTCDVEVVYNPSFSQNSIVFPWTFLFSELEPINDESDNA